MSLAKASLSNRIAILAWLDSLASNQHIELPYASAPLAPSDEVLICMRNHDLFSVCLGDAARVLHSFTAEQWQTKVTSLVHELVTQTSRHLMSELPPSLRRLFLWRASNPNAKDSSSVDTLRLGALDPNQLQPETAYFYRLLWQHYRSDSVAITSNERVCFVIGHDQTERIGIRSGTVRQRYNGPCLTDTNGRVYTVEEGGFSRLKTDGSTLWATKIEISSLHQGLLSTARHLVVPDLHTIRCLDARDGHLLWTIAGEFNVSGLYGRHLIVSTETQDFELFTIDIHTGNVRKLVASSHHLVASWWRAPYGVYLLAPNGSHAATQLLYLDGRRGTTHQYSLPPCRPRGGASHTAGFTMVLESEGRQLLCEVGLTAPSIRLTAIAISHSIEQVIHVRDARIVLLSADGHLICLDSSAAVICWQQFFGNTPLERLRQSCVHESHLLIPSTPPQILHLRTGDIIGTIDSKLYANAIPVLVRSDRVMLKDDYGYIGLFELSGFITPAELD